MYAGGPVKTDRGFVFAFTKTRLCSESKLSSDIMITTSKDVLASLTTSEAPEQFIIALGYAGWDQGRLEQELLENSWLIIKADPEIIFNTPVEKRWEKAVSMLGFDIGQLSSGSWPRLTFINFKTMTKRTFKPLGERTVMGFDFGTKSIGIAIGQELTGTASSLQAVKARDGIPDCACLKNRWMSGNQI